MPKPLTINGVPLPSWTDAASVTSYLTSIASLVFAILAILHPGWTEPIYVPGLIGSAGLLVAGAAQIFNFVTHRNATAAVAQAAVAGKALAE